MSQKLTLARYLEGRGSVKSLTRIEADAFGVPYPLVSGWPARYGPVEITDQMLQDLETRVACAKRSTAEKARRGLAGVGSNAPEPLAPLVRTGSPQSGDSHSGHQLTATRAIQGFVLRKARRYRARGAAPWA